jgi:hypothetical protein
MIGSFLGYGQEQLSDRDGRRTAQHSREPFRHDDFTQQAKKRDKRPSQYAMNDD